MDIIAEFSDNQGLSCKLTKDRLHVSSLGNEETFALRGVNGIGIYDDLEKYNSELTVFKSLDAQKKNAKKVLIYFGYLFYFISACFIIIGGLKALIIYKSINKLLIAEFVGVLLAFLAYKIQKSPVGSKFNVPEPKLETYLRVILTGGERKFIFNKSENNSVYIADFINKLEQTLTAYN
jgi:hypothetical protein